VSVFFFGHSINVMKTLKLIALPSFILIACGPSTEQLKEEILETERAFSAMSKEKGMTEAFIFYAAEERIKPNPINSQRLAVML
jgi:hypothetical protein